MFKAKSVNSETEWLSLDDYVSGDDKNGVLYVRVRGDSMIGLNINAGDLVVVQRKQKPVLSDLVLYQANNLYSVKRFADVENFSQPLRLVARNGAAVESQSKVSVQILGVVTHIVKIV